jgi:RND family efflux transporter MFP subunit
MNISKKRVFAVCVFVGIGASTVVAINASFGGPAKSAKSTKIPLVSVVTASMTDMPIEYTAQGHLVALNQVDVRPQVTGTILKVYFKEGDDVHAGQALFSLDATDATAQLNKYIAQAAQINAQLADAQRDYTRSRELVKSDFIAPSAVDTAASKVDALQAQLTAARADIDSARVALSHTRITAPVSAKAGAVTVHPGSLAQLSATAPLVTLVQFDPIGVEFTLPEQNLKSILTARMTAPVMVSVAAPNGKNIDGQLSFINNTVNADTATISLKASIPNPHADLWPGSFARVIVHAGIDKNVVVLPPQALLEGPSGRFVYTVGADSKVAQKKVTLLRIQQEKAVVEGIASGERVVLEGGQNLRPGVQVQVASQQAPAHPPIPSANAAIMASGAAQ